MTRIVILVIVLAICAGGYYYFFAGDEGVLGGAESYQEAQDDFGDIRPAETVWTPELNTKQASSAKKK